jgi:amino acid adenylation domain-containing protein
VSLSSPSLSALFAEGAARFPDRVAVLEPGGPRLSYRELDRLSDRVRDRLALHGVGRGDRVGIHLPKSIDSLATVLGVLKTGAAYVPVDPHSPPARAAFIFHDGAVKVVVIEEGAAAAVERELAALGSRPVLIRVPGVGGGGPLAGAVGKAPPAALPAPDPEDLAYVLYTSGSTGKPKGVMLTHQAAVSFVDWCTSVFQPVPEDSFSSHAPFHFDLSILDLYLPLRHGARVVLIGEELGKEPMALAQMIASEQITIWYSTPSILNMLTMYGRLPRHDLTSLRIVLFAGEVFPVPQLRALKKLLSKPRYFNLYGPTETNVCTCHPIPSLVPEDRTEPYPIGRTCAHLRSRVVDSGDRVVPRGEEGELLIAGPGIMSGYWNLPERNAVAFVRDQDGTPWYRTGDLVVEEEDGTYLFHGRRDRMVKRRGYRIELGEIEAGLARHAAVREVAVVATQDATSGVRITAFLSDRSGGRPSLIELKGFCVEVLPKYMVPDAFVWLESIPRTSTDKTDYQVLTVHAAGGAGIMAAG